MKNGVISYGEAFIDYIAQDLTNTSFKKYLGGSTLNVAVGVQRLGTSSCYLCKLGREEGSQFIQDGLYHEGVNQEFCAVSEFKKVCGVYVHLNNEGERYFHSYVNETPDEQLLKTELDEALFSNTKIFYFGSGTLFHPTARKTTIAAIQLAKKHRNFIAFDPNIRMKRWESEEECRSTIKKMLGSADILKVSEEELLFLSETPTIEAGIQELSRYDITYVWITLGEKGAIAIHQENVIHVPGKKAKVVDTTGAGDAFMAGILHCVASYGLPETVKKLTTYTEYANNLGAIAVTKQGALTASSSIEI